ncbi:MAG TPA: hypothetical protein PLE74_00995 [Candidatus Cloacimonadota bacterium]|nr:hypothetical protein [Candidatus Cloacimonadota bacterium]
MKMDCKISSDGFLFIKRAGTFKKQACPYDKDGGCCGDWCPLFLEPHESPNTGRVQLSLCHAEIICDDFKDERIKTDVKEG